MKYVYIYSNELYHHGIKGQKWGDRNGPPYPLGSEDKSSAEKKEETSSERKHLTDKQKRIIKGAAIGTGVVLATAGVVYLAKTGKLTKLKEAGKNFLSKNQGMLGYKVTGRQAISASEFVESAKNINPSGGTTTCGSCGSAILYNMTHIGGQKAQALAEVPEDMRAIGRLGYDPDKLISCFKSGSGKWQSVSGMNRKAIQKAFEQQALAYGEGSKGLLFTDKLSRMNSGHYFTWTVHKGQFTILEGQSDFAQSGIIWNTSEQLWDNVFSHFDPNSNMSITRLDSNGIVQIKEGLESKLFSLR